MANAARDELLNLILKVSFERRKVVLASGRESDFYLDLRQTLMRPRGVALAGRLALECLSEGAEIDAVGGMAVGAVPFVSAVLAAADRSAVANVNQAATSAANYENLVGFFVRKESKKHGLARQIEGGFQSGMAVALLEDTTTTGGSTLDACRIVEAAGGKVARVLCLVDRGEGAKEAFTAAGYRLESLFSRSDLPV
ncbi:MAG: orotate phosphoribosyltransferase [Planctomycetota bacterium]